MTKKDAKFFSKIVHVVVKYATFENHSHEKVLGKSILKVTLCYSPGGLVKREFK